MKRTHNVCLTVDEYEKDGQTKKKRITIGTMMTDDQSGNMSLVLNVPPTFKINQKGYPEAWLSLFPIENNNKQQNLQNQYQQQSAPQQGYNQSYQPPPMPEQQYHQQAEMPF